MRVLTSFALISAFLTMDALAASVAPNTRSRPGSVTGAMLMNAQSQSRANTTGGTTSTSTSTSTTSTTTTAATTETDDECGEVIEKLGVDICVAREVCAGIQADGHKGVFDEENLTCQIPVCAHNWSGVIQKDDVDVCTLVDMNTAMICNEELFDQVTALRRSSQWVVPLTVAGGAGIGAGIGAVIDKKQEAKAAELASKSAANDKLYEDMKNSISEKLTFMGVDYNLKDEKDRKALKAVLEGSKDLKSKITEANELIDSCAHEMFKELVSLEVKGSKKWGRIKISENIPSCSTDDNDYIYCQFQNLHSTADKTGDCDKGNFSTTQNINPTYTPAVNSTNPKIENYYMGNNNNVSNIPNGTCYFRDSQGSGETDTFATVQADLWRTEFLTNYRENAQVDDTYDSQFRTDLKNKLMPYIFNKNQVNATGVNGKILNSVLVIGPEFKTVLNLQAPKQCTEAAINAILPTENNMSGGSTNNILMQAYGALLGLQQTGDMDDNMEAFFSALQFIDVYASAVANYNAGLGLEIEENFGKQRGFFDKAIGRGLIIGSSVGAVTGLGYWFAEGASTFCNVGDMEQVKLKKSYSIPSFRDYMYDKGFLE